MVSKFWPSCRPALPAVPGAIAPARLCGVWPPTWRTPMIATSPPAGRRAAERLRDEIIAWLATVRPDGQPQPSPVWFLWQEPDILMYSKPNTPKLRNLEGNPRVALHLEGN